MFKPRFSLAAVLVMVAVVILISTWMFRMDGGGFEYTRGVPFPWYHWADYKHASPFNFLGLIGDILFWLPAVLCVGVLTDKLFKQR